MTLEPREIGIGKNVAAESPQVEFAVVLSRIIDSIERDPAQLRSAVYELARIKLRREALRRNPTLSPLEARHFTIALESAIEGVETIYSKHDELRALRSLAGIIETSQVVRSDERPEPLRIIDQPLARTPAGDLARAKDRSPTVQRSLYWPGAAPLVRGALVAIFAVALCAALDQFGLFGRQERVPVPSHYQSESAPIAPPAIARIEGAPANFRPRRFADAGAPALAWGDAPSYSGHDPSTVAPDEQSVKPPRPSCSTQTYKVPSERGGEASISVVRC
jgi:hypothetical protein